MRSNLTEKKCDTRPFPHRPEGRHVLNRKILSFRLKVAYFWRCFSTRTAASNGRFRPSNVVSSKCTPLSKSNEKFEGRSTVILSRFSFVSNQNLLKTTSGVTTHDRPPTKASRPTYTIYADKNTPGFPHQTESYTCSLREFRPGFANFPDFQGNDERPCHPNNYSVK